MKDAMSKAPKVSIKSARPAHPPSPSLHSSHAHARITLTCMYLPPPSQPLPLDSVRGMRSLDKDRAMLGLGVGGLFR